MSRYTLTGCPRFGVHLFHRYKLRLVRYLHSRVADVHLAEDLAQEVFLRVFRAAQGNKFAGRSGVKTWIFTIANNCLIDCWRSSRRRAAVAGPGKADQFESAASTPDCSAADSEQRALILAAINQLPDDQQQVVGLKFFANMTFAEIAEVVGVSISTIKSRMRYALIKLEHSLSLTIGEDHD